jgi:MFS family permease
METAAEELPLRRNWRFQLVWAGAGVSGLGASAVHLALPILILVATGQPLLAGTAATVSMVANLAFAAPAGVLVDRLDRRKILIWSEIVEGLIWGVFALLASVGAVSLWSVVLVSAISGAGGAFGGPAHSSAIQALVPSSQLGPAYAQGQARAYGIQMAGPPLGGLLFAVGRVAPFAFQVLASTVSVLLYVVARVPRRPADESRPASADEVPPSNPRSAGAWISMMRTDFTEALRWLLAQRGFRAVLGVAVFINPLVNAIWVPLIVLVHDRGGAALNIGIIMAASGIGGLCGSLLASRLSRAIPAGWLVLIVGGLAGVCDCLIPLPLGTYWPMVPIICSCILAPSLNVGLMALLGAHVPSSLMGRMSSVLSLTFNGLTPLGPVIGGLLAATMGGSRALVACGLPIVGLTVVAALSPDVRNLRVNEPLHETPVEKWPVAGLEPEVVAHADEAEEA